ncbi:hypothetical protein GCM10022215_43720 [Nocardioides fonticola]|uniref:HEAT repeat domain-containing protein n=1 Tax=Nocardioides fonticola TaxID=450363 RepID=A0ABP7Y481_9ACTN
MAGLNERGIAADLSRVSRWESGTQPVPGRVVLAYESILGLPSGSLLATARAVQRAGGGRSARPDAGVYTDDAARGAAELENLLELATSARPRMNGGDWLRLAVELSRFEYVFLPRTGWRVLCSRLIGELARTSGADQLRRYEACVVLVQHPQGQGHMVRALGEWLLHPDVQVAAPMLSLLQEIDAEAASQLVLRLLGVEVRPVRDGALSVAAAKLARSHFDPTTVVQLEAHGRRRILGAPNPALLVNALDLVAQLPPHAYDALVAEVRDPLLRSRVEQARQYAELMPTEVGRSLARSIATQTQDATSRVGSDSDRMLEHLIHELLSHVHEPRRAAAGRLIAASPYHAVVADRLLELTADDNDLVATRAWDALLTLGSPGRRDVAARAIAETRPHVRVGALAALRGCPAALDDAHGAAVADIARTTSAPDIRSHALTTLGLRSPTTLEALIDATPEITRAVYWWQGVGSAHIDDDTAPAS